MRYLGIDVHVASIVFHVPVSAFAQVRVVNAAASSGVIEVVARNGLVVRLGSAVNSEALVRVLAAVLRC